MTNGEKYADIILEFAISHNQMAVYNGSKKPAACEDVGCSNCLFMYCGGCGGSYLAAQEWAESEYIEQPKISKKDRAFLDYIRDVYNFVVRNKEGKLFLYGSKPRKTDDGVWVSISGAVYCLKCFDINLPMVKREDKEPWTVGDLKNLEVCDEY